MVMKGDVGSVERWCDSDEREAWKLSAANSMSTGPGRGAGITVREQGWPRAQARQHSHDLWQDSWQSRLSWELFFSPCPTPLQWGSNQQVSPIRYGFGLPVCCIESVDMTAKDPLCYQHTGVFLAWMWLSEHSQTWLALARVSGVLRRQLGQLIHDSMGAKERLIYTTGLGQEEAITLNWVLRSRSSTKIRYGA